LVIFSEQGTDKCLLDDTILIVARTMPRAAASSLSRCPDLNKIPVRVAPIPARHLNRCVYIGVTKARPLSFNDAPDGKNGTIFQFVLPIGLANRATGRVKDTAK